jgi:anti-sigma regulatory factor (Ser/Thr protein kinase)
VEISRQRGEGFALVTPGQVVTPGDADTLHHVLLQAFAEGDDAVVCDLTAAGEAPAARRIVLAVAERVSPWPGAVLVVLGERMSGECPSAGIAVAGRLADAVELVARRPRPSQARRILEPLLEAPALARAILRRTLSAWGADGYGDDALIVVDELVANAVLHAGTEIELRLALHPDRLGIAVADRSAARPSLEHPGGGAEHGRGLLLVDAVAGAWHVLPRPHGGKVVRAVLVAAPSTAEPRVLSSSQPWSVGPRGGPS